MLNFVTIVNKSCKCDLYHLGEPYNLDGKHTLVEKMFFMIGLLDCVVYKAMLFMPFLVVYAMCSCIHVIMEACFLPMK
jgi:hypothetical protein